MLFKVAAVVLASLAPSALALWPMPHSLTEGSKTLILSYGFQIELQGALSGYGAPDDFKAAVARTYSQLKHDKLERLVVGGGAVDAGTFGKAKQLRQLNVKLTGKNTPTTSVLSIAKNAQLPLSQRSEAYELTVPSDGSAATLSASSTLGLFHGLATFTQIWYYHAGTTYAINAPLAISDKPAYPYRGFMLDTARTYFPVSDILRTLDGMSYVKANQFHWHIVDSQSFPLVVPGFPELSAKGAYSASQVYTPADVAEVVSYAGARGIDVMIEIDTPGHTAAISDSHPDWIACNNAAPWYNFANEPPAGQLRLASPAVLKFVSSLIKDVISVLPSKYFSTGGDEINANCYTQDAETQAELTKAGQTFEEGLSAFVGVAHKAVHAGGKIPVVWEEMVINHNVTLTNDTVVMVWVSSENAKIVADAGFQIVHAPSDYFYLDCGGGGWLGADPLRNSWCDPFKTWQKAYVFNPLANITAAQSHLILGGQSLLWTEQSGPENLDPVVWPRAASVAEVFWTGATLPDGTAANTAEALPRLHDIRYRFVQRGINAINLQPKYCALRPHVCDL